jgi:hydrogenase maturation protease
VDGPAGAAPVAGRPGVSAAATVVAVQTVAPSARRRVVVIGVGNEMRRDDGAGIAVVERARPLLPPDVEVRTLGGEATALLDAWAGADLAVVVDAVRWAHSPATGVTRIDVTSAPDAVSGFEAGTSSHGLGVAAALALGRALERLPPRLILLLIALAEEGHGEGLSPTVEQHVDDAVALLLAEVQPGVSV